jgi:hypothetical protein
MTEPVSNNEVSYNPDEHPAVDAWLLLDATHPMPENVSALYAAKLAHGKNKNKRKSSVYKLEGAGLDGATIVAKRCSRSSAAVESSIYEHILPELPICSLQYHGHVSMGDYHWLFLEYANGVEWELDDTIHRELAIRWLAELHGGSEKLDVLALLPNRGPSYYLSQLTTARQRMLESVANSVLAPADTEILNAFIACSHLLEAHWQDIEAFCETMPETLVHNDFLPQNIHVRSTNSGPRLFAFDWEMSGRGVPAADLFWMFQQALDAGITRYWEHLKKFNTSVGLQDIEHLAILGAIFRITDAVEWVSRYLLTETPDRKIHHTRLHTDRLKQAFHVLGWS